MKKQNCVSPKQLDDFCPCHLLIGACKQGRYMHAVCDIIVMQNENDAVFVFFHCKESLLHVPGNI